MNKTLHWIASCALISAISILYGCDNTSTVPLALEGKNNKGVQVCSQGYMLTHISEEPYTELCIPYKLPKSD